MGQIKTGRLRGAFRGFEGRETEFTFTDGERWRQDEYRYQNGFVYEPTAIIDEDMGLYFMQISNVPGRVRVRKV
jgi:hypothetical protein